MEIFIHMRLERLYATGGMISGMLLSCLPLKCGDAYAIIISLFLLNKTSTNSDVKLLK